MFGDHGLCGLLEEGAHGKSPKCLDGNLGDFGEFCKGLGLCGLLEEGAHGKSPKCLGGNLGDFEGILQRSQKEKKYYKQLFR